MSQHDHFRFRPNASSGKAVVVYRLTKLHKASFAVSLLTLAGTLFAIWFTRRKQRRKQAEASGSASAATSAG